MAKNSHIGDDWSFRYTDQFFFHVDGILNYDTNAGTAPSLDQYIKGGTSGAVARIIGGSDLGGTDATGTLTLTVVSGKFVDGEAIVVLDELAFDTVTNGGFPEDSILTGPTTEQFTCDRVEYNYGTVSGEGICFGSIDTTGFANNEIIEINGGGVTVSLVNTAAETDNSALFTNALVNDLNGLARPGTTNENDCAIIHYDAGTIDIPVEAVVADASTGGIGIVVAQFGDTVTGSLKLVDFDETPGSITNDNVLNINEVIFYDNQVGGQVFKEGDIATDGTTGARARVLAVIDDGDSSGKLITASREGTFTAPNDLEVEGVKIAQVENATTILAAAVINIPDGIRIEQLSEDGGIYLDDESLNITRKSNELYTHGQTTFALLAQMDDPEPFSAQVRDGTYTIINSWQTLDRCMRYLVSGGWQDEDGNNIWTNPQSILQGPLVTNRGFFYSSASPQPMPKIYIEQDSAKVDPFWIEGAIDFLLKIKTRHDTRYIDPSVDTLGQLINSANQTYFVRRYGFLYAIFVTAAAKAASNPIPLTFGDDNENNTGEKRVTYTGAGGFTVGEEVRGSTGGRAIVVAEDTVGDTLDVNYLTAAALSGTITGEVSAATATFSSEADRVSGYNTDIREMVVNGQINGGTTTGTWQIGELLTQVTSGATGYLVAVSAADDLYIQKVNGVAFDTSNQIDGAISGADYQGTFSVTTNDTTFPADLGDGNGEENYNGQVGADITASNPRFIAEVYEWMKYISRDISTVNIQDKGVTTTTPGFFFRFLDATYTEVTAAPIGTFAGGKMAFAQGWFIVKEDLDTTDLQNFTLINAAGANRTPPNLQSILVNLATGDSIAVYRSQGSGQENILRDEFDVGVVGSGNNQLADNTILVGVGGAARNISPLDADIPDSGILRVEDPSNAGIYLSFIYASVDRTTNIFTLASGTIGDITGGVDLTLDDNVHVVFIEEVATASTASNNVQYIGDVPLFFRYRKLGRQPQQGATTFAQTGVTITPTQIGDGIADVV